MIRLSEPQLTGNELNAINDVIVSGKYVMGEQNEKFEKEFAKACGFKHACALSSGTAALHLALITADVCHGDEVIVPAFGFVADSNVVEYVGAKPVFCDVDRRSGLMDVHLLRSLVTARTRAIIAVHLVGNIVDMDAVHEVAEEFALHVIEDCAQAAVKKPHKDTTSAIYSFFPSKNMSVLGYGGMLVTNYESIKENCDILRNAGRVGNQNLMLGYNYRLSEIHAAIGRLQLKEVSKWNDKRKEIHAVYKRILGCHLINYEPSLHTYALVYVMQFCRDNLVKHLVKKGIECKSLYDYALDNSCSEAVLFSKCNVWLPCHASLSVSDAEYIAKVVKKFIEGECNGTICANEKM